jgi:hypothetical protein
MLLLPFMAARFVAQICQTYWQLTVQRCPLLLLLLPLLLRLHLTTVGVWKAVTRVESSAPAAAAMVASMHSASTGMLHVQKLGFVTTQLPTSYSVQKKT